jgi:hypothetical protein
MDFVNEQDIPGAQVREDGSQIPGPFNGGTGGHFYVHTHFVGNNMRQRGLPQTRRAIKQNMIQGLAASTGGSDENPKILLDLVLADQLGQLLRTKGVIDAVVGFRFGVQLSLMSISHEAIITLDNLDKEE